MPDLAVISLVLNITTLALVFLILRRSRIDELASFEKALDRLERTLRAEAAQSRSEAADNARMLREELAGSVGRFQEAVLRRLHENTGAQMAQLEAFANILQNFTRVSDQKADRLREEVQAMRESNEQRLDKLREVVDGQLKALHDDNSRRLEEMRRTVDEKLHATLEKRLGESFRLVSERLEQVHKGLGEMQALATGVGDLKRVLTNVKARGIWGEYQLAGLLEQILTPDQYAQNVATKPGSSERVEFAVKLPGRDGEGAPVWLPIDAKFPQEDYQRLLDAQDKADAKLAEEAARALENRLRAEARDIAAKYISVPHTTEFAILFLPIEGLYAEVLRRPGLCDSLIRDYRVIVTGPTTLAALLNSLQMGFRTLAIEKRSAEVWQLLGAVKTEFSKFGDLLDKTSRKLQEASASIETAARKSRTIERKLKKVEELPAEEAVRLLDSAAAEEECE